MSILNVNQIQPVGGGNTITVSASDVSASGATITASSFVGNVTGNVTSSSTSTFSSGLNVTGGNVGIGTNSAEALLDVEGIGQFGNNPLTDTGIQLNGSVGRIRVGRSGNVFEARNGSDSTIKASISGSTGGANFLGSVGIGTDNPFYKFEVRGDTNTEIRIGNFDDSEAGILLSNTGSTNRRIVASGGDMIFRGGASTSDEHVRIDSSGSLGIGTIPKTWSGYNVLQVGSASLIGQSEQDGQTTNWSNNAYFDTNNNRWEYSFADEASQITQADGLIIFKTASTGTANAALSWTESARFNTSGNLAFPSGQGIDFSATGDGSGTSSSELLDDYEEGTFTPTLRGSSTAGTATGTIAGRYIKIGHFVHVSIRINNVNFSGSTGAIRIDGLPYAVASTSNSEYSSAASHMIYNITFDTNYKHGWYVNPGSSSMYGIQSRSGQVWQDWASSNFHASSIYMNQTITYMAA